MRRKLENISTSISEPVELSDVKTHLRVDYDDEDVLLTAYISAARSIAENYANRVIAPQQFRLTLDRFPHLIRLPKTPVITIDSFTYVDNQGATQPLSSGTGYHFSNEEFDPVLVPPYTENWPDTEDGYEKVVITFTAGYSSPTEIIKSAIMLIIGDLYMNRESSAPVSLQQVPFGAKALLDSIRKGVA